MQQRYACNGYQGDEHFFTEIYAQGLAPKNPTQLKFQDFFWIEDQWLMIRTANGGCAKFDSAPQIQTYPITWDQFIPSGK